MRVKANEPVECSIPAPAGPPPMLGARIEAPLGAAVIVPWVPAELSSSAEVDDHGERYTAWWTTVTFPSVPEGDHLIAWLSAEDDAPVVGYLPLAVSPA